MEEWLTIYRNYTVDQLNAEITALQAQSANPFTTQTEGERSYSISQAQLRDKLSAAMQARNEKTNRATPRSGVADFGRGIW